MPENNGVVTVRTPESKNALLGHARNYMRLALALDPFYLISPDRVPATLIDSEERASYGR
jgi:hypothetical protein